MAPQQQDHVQLVLSLHCEPPQLSYTEEQAHSKFLKLFVTIEQTASPFPDRAVTILTKYSCLDTTPGTDAFRLRSMGSPQLVTPDPDFPAPELPLHLGSRVTHIRVSGDPDMLKRDRNDGFTFVTIPPVGQGHAEIVFEVPPERLVQRLGGKDEPVPDKLLRYLRPGDVYRIKPRDLSIRWWTFGSLEDEASLKGKKLARWSLPDELPLDRKPGEDENDGVASKLKDYVDLHNVNKLSSRSAVEGEEKPEIGKMRSEGWVFGEPKAGLVMVVGDEGKEATFTIVE